MDQGSQLRDHSEDDLKNRMNCILVQNSYLRCKELNQSVPITAGTTFTFSSVFILLLCVKASNFTGCRLLCMHYGISAVDSHPRNVSMPDFTERQEFDKHCTVYVLYDLPGCDGVEAACGDHQHHHPDLKGGPRHTAEEL